MAALTLPYRWFPSLRLPYGQLILCFMLCLPGLSWGQLRLGYTLEQAPDCGQANGRITLQAEGGQPPYQYALVGQPGQSNTTLDSLGTGRYRAWVADTQLDTAYVDLLISHANGPLPDALTPQDPTCAGAIDGSLQAQAGQGVQYSLDGSLYQSAGLFTQLAAGRYFLHLRDAGGCLTLHEVVLSDPPALRMQRDSLRHPGCVAPQDGHLAFRVQGGTPPYQYQWSHRNNWNQPYAPDLGAGSYTLTVQDSQGCIGTAAATLSVLRPLQGSLTAQAPTCADRADGELIALVSGGLAPYTYRWGHGPSEPQLSNLSPGLYPLTVQDRNGCLWQDSARLTAPAPISVAIGLTPGLCDGNGATLLAQASGGTPPLRYQWSNGQTGDSLSGLPNGPLRLQVSDARGCRLDTQVVVRNQAPVETRIVVDRDLSRPVFLSSAKLDFGQQSSGAAAFEWHLNGELFSVDAGFFHHFNQLGPQQLILTAYGADLGCLARDTLTFEIIADGKVLLPSAFTPNDDGINDTFRPYAEGVTYFEMEIFDQWGKSLARVQNLEQGWDGRTQAGTWAPEGVYAYRLYLRYNDGSDERVGGSIILMR